MHSAEKRFFSLLDFLFCTNKFVANYHLTISVGKQVVTAEKTRVKTLKKKKKIGGKRSMLLSDIWHVQK